MSGNTSRLLYASIIIDAPDDLRPIVAETVAELNLLNRYVLGWPRQVQDVFTRGLRHCVTFWTDDEGYHAKVTTLKDPTTILWHWDVSQDEAAEGWPFLSAAEAPITLKHDEVAA